TEGCRRPDRRMTKTISRQGPVPNSADPVEPVKILLVDDSPENLLSAGAVLESLGQEVIKAESGREALRHLLDHDFAVILLDVMMPEMDGFETAAMVRQRERSRLTPIIFLTELARGRGDQGAEPAPGAAARRAQPGESRAGGLQLFGLARFARSAQPHRGLQHGAARVSRRPAQRRRPHLPPAHRQLGAPDVRP